MKTLILLLFTVAMISCTADQANRSNSRSANAEVKKGVTPVADNEIAVIEMENAAAYGTIIPKVPTARSVRSAT